MIKIIRMHLSFHDIYIEKYWSDCKTKCIRPKEKIELFICIITITEIIDWFLLSFYKSKQML